MAEANGTETPHTRTVPEPDSTTSADTVVDHPHNESHPKITRGEEGLTDGSAAPINRFLLPRSYTLLPTLHPL